MELFDKYAFTKAFCKYLLVETGRLRKEIKDGLKYQTDLLHRKNKLETENAELRRRLKDPVEKLERDLFNN